MDVLRLVAKGYGNKEIAGRLHVSLHTVKNHVHSILEKTGTDSRDAAASKFLDLKQIEHPCTSCPARKVDRVLETIRLIAEELRRLAAELEGSMSLSQGE